MEGSKEDNKDSKVVSCNDSNMVKTIKLESFDVNGSGNNCHSFSELLRNVLSRNSPCPAIKAQHQMPQKTPGVLKPEVAREQVELHRECAKPCVSLLSLTPAAVSRRCSAPVAASTIDIYTPQKIVETPAVDDYSWRKYGQKQVKNTNTHRSYYRCTTSDCLAKKKVQQCDQSGYVINVVHVGNHNHDPPQRSRNRSKLFTSSEKNSVAKPAEVPLLQKVDRFDIDNANAQQSSQHMPRSEVLCTNSSTGNTGRVKAEEEHGKVLESKQPCSSCGGSQKCSSYWTANTEVQEKHDAEQSPQKRKEDSNNSHLDSTLKATKKHKTIVQDAKNSPDGFRWRKYGQKLVKGNSHTRSYYRCKLAGCHARKQIEKAIDDATAIAITYEGEHNHDLHVDDAYVPVSSTTPVINANYKNTEASTDQNPLTNWSVEMELAPIVEKVLKNGVVKDNISGAKNLKVPLVEKVDCSDMNSADVRQSSDHMSGSEPQSSNISDFNIRKVNVEDQHVVTPESKQVFCSNGRGSWQSSSSWVANTEIQENIDFELEPNPKKRKEDGDNSRSETVKATKKHNIVVQDTTNIRTSHDHCRWRKYGQKLVKGNSHTRSYYRCTLTGCPARKHVESAISDATATTVTFEGEHKHDVPVSRKQCVPDNPTTSMNNASYEKIESLSCPGSLAKRPKDREGELLGERVMELGGEKALESAKTLLSIKVEVRQ